ncbi:helix-turn-helix transcriptional regulator [Eubacterium callanderi]|uniref:helix-turn-helix transcriptional regulator n=1 Tax=Eubacterium callanderi TaxID=53442 RepID=UPI001D085043|nr:helix-turn-helix domain-containing protein [Eubacterium callanderi]MCB6661261.1 helix-turn-helix domain-containing protein [Eubacterium callanderi]MCB6754199.1 helix-turn-helix domain-containing protein [Eubacterium callanderi]MCB7103588.1 helix-turn-helix domain-containing protein [Eubacterium callanderi]MCG4818645.1 helix-turn-helix domain-containing protein [Eubacterium callanderi]MCQ5191730.1 helix-turn-helix domain-containing protein [Eubacterium callanderi]
MLPTSPVFNNRNTVRAIGRIERGERNPSLEMAIRLAHYLNMGVEDIFKLDDGTSSQKKTED